LAVLDGDTRAYLQLLVNGAGEGLKGRGNDLADLFRRFEPTHRDIALVTQAVAQRRQNLRRLINSLAILNRALTEKKSDLSSLVTTSSKVFRAFASQDANIESSLRDLPGTLRITTSTLGKVQRFAEILRPAAEDLIPVANAIPPANQALINLAPVATPILRNQIRPFVRDARPLLRALKPAAQNLSLATPHLRKSFTVLNHLFNTIAYNPRGREAVNVPGRQEGFLFWIAWLDHQALTVFNAQDAHGTFRQLFLQASCSSLKEIVAENAGAEFALNLTPIFNSPLCKTS
jgi:phospholipid/cholesterol/gamma-HCH transport system substrate-binding protein